MRERRYVKKIPALIVLLFLQLLVFTSLALFISDTWQKKAASTNQVFGDVRIADVSLSGLNQSQAEQRLIPVVQRINTSPVTLTLDGNTHSIDMSQLHLAIDLNATLAEAKKVSENQSGVFAWVDRLFGDSRSDEVQFKLTYDRGELSKQVIEISKGIDRKAVPATVQVAGNTAKLIPDIEGYRVNVDQTVAHIEQALQKASPQNPIPIIVEKDIPAVTKTTLAGVTIFMGEQQTQINSSVPKRLQNLTKAAQLLNGTVIMPRQLFSFYDTVGPYTKEKGYEPIPTHGDEEIADGLSGGATQVASTLYVALVKSHISVVERHNNRRPVEFLPIGQDAFVNDRDMDLRFVNNTESPVFIHADVQNSTLRVALISTKAVDGEVHLVNENEEVFPPDTIVRVDPDMLPNLERIVRVGKDGFRSKEYAVWTDKNGKEQKQLLSDDFYKPLHNIIAAGAKIEGEESQIPEGTLSPDSESSVENSSGDSMRPPDIDLLPSTTQSSSSGKTGSSTGSSSTPTSKDKKPDIIYLN